MRPTVQVNEQAVTGIGGEMAWPLVIAGMLFAVGLILIKSPSVMLISVGMYLPFKTTFAIFIGGAIKYVVDKRTDKIAEGKADAKKLEGDEKNKFVTAIKDKSESLGLLLASGLVAGEALMGILLAIAVGLEWKLNGLIGNLGAGDKPIISGGPIGIILYIAVFAILAYMMISIPVKKLTKSEE